MYQSPKKRKSIWDTLRDATVDVADRVLPGDQQSWKSDAGRPAPVTPQQRQNAAPIMHQINRAAGIQTNKPNISGPGPRVDPPDQVLRESSQNYSEAARQAQLGQPDISPSKIGELAKKLPDVAPKPPSKVAVVKKVAGDIGRAIAEPTVRTSEALAASLPVIGTNAQYERMYQQGKISPETYRNLTEENLRKSGMDTDDDLGTMQRKFAGNAALTASNIFLGGVAGSGVKAGAAEVGKRAVPGVVKVIGRTAAQEAALGAGAGVAQTMTEDKPTIQSGLTNVGIGGVIGGVAGAAAPAIGAGIRAVRNRNVKQVTPTPETSIANGPVLSAEGRANEARRINEDAKTKFISPLDKEKRVGVNTEISADLAQTKNVDFTVKPVKTNSVRIGSDALGDIDRIRVDEYKAHIVAGRPIDPLVVSREGDEVFVQDGKHRLAAMKELGIEDAPTVTQTPKAAQAVREAAVDAEGNLVHRSKDGQVALLTKNDGTVVYRNPDVEPANPVMTKEAPPEAEPVAMAPSQAPEMPVNATPEATPELTAPAKIGNVTQEFYDSKKGDNAVTFEELEDLGKQVAQNADAAFKEAGSDFPTVARRIEEARRAGAKSLDEVDLSDTEKSLWRGVQSEMDYVRRRASLGRREIGEGDFGELYFPNQAKYRPGTPESLLEGFENVKPGNEIARGNKIDIDELSFDPEVVGDYIVRYGDTKLLQEERLAKAVARNNPGASEEAVGQAVSKIMNIQNKVNSLTTKMKLGVKKVTVANNGKKVDTAAEMSEVGRGLGKPQMVIADSPVGLTNGDRVNSVSVSHNGRVQTVGDLLGLNQYRDSLPYAGTQTKQANGDRDALAEMVGARLQSSYNLSNSEVNFLVESVRRIKASVPDEVVSARVAAVYRNAAKSQLMEGMQKVNITNKSLRSGVSDLTNQILREGTIEQKLSAKVVQNTLRTTNALFRKLNVSSALNELSDLTSFVTVYGRHTKLAQPDFKLIQEMGLGELDPAIEPFLKQIDEGADPQGILRNLATKANEGTRFYKYVEAYKAGVFLRTSRDFYAARGLTGDALTAQVLDDYRKLALPVDAFTKTFLDDFPLFTQYLTWGARNIQKEGRLISGQIDAGIMKDKTTAQRIARDVYANIPAKTAFWLASNGLKGTTFMTAVGLTDFTGLTNQDYSGIAEEDKSFFDKTTQFTNISTIASLVNTTVQALEKEYILKPKYANEDYNPYGDNNFQDSFINTFTPQSAKNILDAKELQEKGYSVNKGDRVQYEAADDDLNLYKSFLFGKNQTKNAREYSGNKNIFDRVAEGQNPATAVKDMAAEQLGIQDTKYNRPLTKDYSEAYKQAEEGANTALLQGGRQYNGYLDNLKRNNPDSYNKYIEMLDTKNAVNPEYWRTVSGDKETFNMIRNRKQQLKKDLGKGYDPLYDLPNDKASAVMRYMSAPTGDDLAVRNTLNKEKWYQDFKKSRNEFYDNKSSGTEFEGKTTQRVKDWNKLDDELGNFYFDKDSTEKPAWADKYPLVYQQKAVNAKYGFDSPESKAFFKANADGYQAQKEGFDKAQLAVINKMRKIEGFPEMSWEGYQQATEIADTDPSDDKYGKYGKVKVRAAKLNTDFGRIKSAPTSQVKAVSKKVAVAPRSKGGFKKVTVKRSKAV